jgi:phosphate transport system substrate-binding protein
VRLCAVLLAAVLISGCGSSNSRSSTSGSRVLVGAGSTLVFPLVAKWIPDYSRSHGVTITYGPIGSGGGIHQLTNRTLDFGATDAPLSPDQRAGCKGCVQIPWALSGTSIAYNVAGAPQHLKLTGPVIADMFLGKIASWNDPAIARLNPGVKLPAVAVAPIHRRDASGTTYNFTDFLSRVSPAWKSRVGTGTSVDFPVGAGGQGSAGVAAALSTAHGAIGYIDAAYAIENGFSYAAVQNRAGRYVFPERPAVAAAAATLSNVPPDNAVSIVDPPASAAAAYPISTFTYAVVPQKTAKADLLRPFLTYAIGPGQRFGAALQFARLPAKILQADKATIAKLRKS